VNDRSKPGPKQSAARSSANAVTAAASKERRELTRGALAEMRTLLMELRPNALLDAPLPDLLQQLCDAFQGRVRIPVDLTAEEGEKLPPEAQVVFYRIAQESLSNIAKHARAQHVSLSFFNHHQQVRMEIQDDGVGFDVQATPGDHFGLAIMKERAQTIGAQYQIESSPSQGTQIRLTWRRMDGFSAEAPEPQVDQQPQM
jgi:signal transduction histidine kinase